MKWAQDNLCEDIGGIYGYYTKMEYMNDPANADAQELRDWYAGVYNPFDAQHVQQQLCKMLISEEMDEENDAMDLEEFYDDLETLLMYIEDEKTSIIKIKFENESFYLRAHAGDKEFIQIFANKDDCAFASLHQVSPIDPYPFYVEGICIDFPSEDEIMDDENGWQPVIFYHERGVGMRETTDEDFTIICTILDELVRLYEILSPEYMFPNLEDKQMAELSVDEKSGVLREIALDFEDPLIPVTCTTDEAKELAKSNKTKDIVYVSIAPIENLFDNSDTRDIVYYLLFHSAKQKDYQHIETMDYDFMSPLLKKLLLKYVREYGRPKTICCEDGHIKDMIQPFCDTFKIKLRCKKMDKEPFIEEYAQAFEEQNPMYLIDHDFMQKIMEGDEDFLREIIEGNDEAKKCKLQKYMNFLDMFAMTDF